MYVYLLNNGREFEDYAVVGIAISPTPIDWPQVRADAEQWLNDNKATAKDAHLMAADIAAMFTAAGVPLVEYEELSFDPRRSFGRDGRGVGEWYIDYSGNDPGLYEHPAPR